MPATFSQQGSIQVVPRLVDGLAVLASNAGRQLALTNGTASGQANGYHTQTLSIAAGESTTIDLRSLPVSLLGASGTLALASVKTLLVLNLAESTGITVAPGTTDGWDKLGTTPLGGSGTLLIHSPASGVATSATSKTLRLTNTDSIATLSGNTTAGSATVSGLSSTSGLEVGMLVAGAGIPAGSTITTIANGTSVVISANATANGSAVSLTFRRPPASVEIHAVGIKV